MNSCISTIKNITHQMKYNGCVCELKLSMSNVDSIVQLF